jgi:hypothetical protein
MYINRFLLLLLSSLCRSYSALAQVATQDYVIENYHSLTKTEWVFDTAQWKKTQEQQEILMRLVKDSTFTFCLDEPHEYNSLEDYYETQEALFALFSFVDIDKDGDEEIVLNGRQCPGFESESVIIYSLRDGLYKRIVSYPGKIVSWIDNEMIIYSYPCCEMIDNIFICLEFKQQTIYEKFSLTLYYNEFYKAIEDRPNEFDHLIPAELKKIKDCRVKRNSRVHYLPQNALSKKSIIEDNLIFVSKKKQDISVYSSYQDNNGETWYYCKVPHTQPRTLGANDFILGWVNKQCCKNKRGNQSVLKQDLSK